MDCYPAGLDQRRAEGRSPRPCTLGIKKAVSIVQSRAYLEQQARRLLGRFTKEAGTWHLSTIDFGAEAQGHAYEFLMCFDFQASTGVLPVTSPFVDISFTLPEPTAVDPVFVIAVASAFGVPR